MSYCVANPVGGLGNQLFCIAAAFGYTKKHNKELIIDPSGWNASQGNDIIEYSQTIFKNFEFGNVYKFSTHSYTEKRFNYDEIPYVGGNISLNGYFQSLKYLEGYEKEFIDLLDLPKINTLSLSDKNVAFHIRRGDYRCYPNKHYVCRTRYFEMAFEIFHGYQINVFTDSPHDVSKEFEKFDFNIIQSTSLEKELAFMSQHDNVVCSNSSLSWWGSLLGKDKKTVIVPGKWFNDIPYEEHKDIFREKMSVINI